MVNQGLQIQMPLLRMSSRKMLPVAFWTAVYFLAVLQDFLFAGLNHTSFYISESMMFNTFWLFFIPFTACLQQLSGKTSDGPVYYFAGKQLLVALMLTQLHILLFTALFILQSIIIYEHPHRFVGILKSVLAHHAFLTFIIYALSMQSRKGKLQLSGARINDNRTAYPDHLIIKQGRTATRISVSTILTIRADKPYCAIHCERRKVLHSTTLKKLSQILDPTVFVRVHRSAIINRKHIGQMESRGNGDYDALLSDGTKVRLSRHLRQNWDHLIPHPGSKVLPSEQ